MIDMAQNPIVVRGAELFDLIERLAAAGRRVFRLDCKNLIDASEYEVTHSPATQKGWTIEGMRQRLEFQATKQKELI